MSQFSDQRFVAAMTTIIIFLPIGAGLVKSFCVDFEKVKRYVAQAKTGG